VKRQTAFTCLIGLYIGSISYAQDIAPSSIWKKNERQSEEYLKELTSSISDSFDAESLLKTDANIEFGIFTAPQDKAGIKDLDTLTAIPQSLAEQIFKKTPDDFKIHHSASITRGEREAFERSLSTRIRDVTKSLDTQESKRFDLFQFRLGLNMHFVSLMFKSPETVVFFMTQDNAKGYTGLAIVTADPYNSDQFAAIVFMRRSQTFSTLHR
jgi:hypothetical protein